ncbi:GTPase [Coemansia reversa NRRL 1564]|uniref:GTPase n=1 Tax=Coemansia reversa (strain ATCC 12441 / NRRL 1564) TaxID=763665 RepID=A0A2G5B7I8_COERN|nr:GTPase [Coemansia reversa NRRL 1564]|eukprot:PIA14996.1 GTPase [Coemansia reversa NRRL 1564]
MSVKCGQRLVRTSFSYGQSINWFPGHMMAGLREMRDQMRNVDLVVETRDARIPLSSINKQFEQIVKGKHRVVVYNKADLAPVSIQATVQKEMAKRSQHALFTDTSVDKSVKQILELAKTLVKDDPVRYQQLVVMIVGMPNVGKSTLINALRRIGVRKGKAASTGAKPGVTRTVSGKIRVLETPAVYLVDTPGVMVPHIPDPIAAIKVALTGGIKDNIADESVLADYLLFRLNLFDGVDYCNVLGIEEPTDDISYLLQMLGKKIGALRRGGEVDIDKTIHFFLRTFRQGKFGRVCLDDLDEGSVEEFFQRNLEDASPSKNQQRKAKRAAQRQRTLERARSRNLD